MFHPRWQATVTYRSEDGLIEVVHDLEEIADLHDLIEAGPHWDTIQGIQIVRVNHSDDTCLTVEAANLI